jgi:dolichol-phosphate mannosyltransferase
VKLSKNFGTHAALRAGILHATADRVVNTYADHQDPLDLIRLLADKLDEGYDIVYALRAKVATGVVERTFSRMYAQLIRALVFKDYPPGGFDIVMFSSKVKAQLNAYPETDSSIFLQIVNFGFRQSTVSYERMERKAGKSKWTFAKKVKLLIDSVLAFSYVPIRLVSVTGLLMTCVGVCWTTVIILYAIIFRDLNPGWPSLVAILMIGFGATNFALGMVAEYLWRTLNAARRRPVFVIDRVVDEVRNEVTTAPASSVAAR